MKKLIIIALSMATAISGAVPAFAFPAVNAPIAASSTSSQINQNDIVKVRHDSIVVHGHRGWHRHGGWRGRHGWHGRGHRWHGYDRRYGHRYYHHRHGGDAAAIIGGLAAGAIIGGALNQPRHVYRGGSSHVRWCYNHYRSYRASDNTYQPYTGGRRQCVSP